jgi:hypothetical protein
MAVTVRDALEAVPLLCALDRPPGLVVDGPGGQRDLGAPGAERTPPIAPRCGARGHVAYLQVADRPAGPAWTCALVLLDAAGAVLDLRPGAFVHGPPCFSADGARLLYVRDVDGRVRELVELDLANGEEHCVLAVEGLRSAAWASDGGIVVSRTVSIDAISPRTRRRHPLIEDPVASGFVRFGTDDLYVTLDAVAVSADGALAWVRTWHQQGRPSRRHVHLERPGAVRREWRDVSDPCFLDDGELVVRAGAAIKAPNRGARRKIAGLGGFDVWRGGDDAP